MDTRVGSSRYWASESGRLYIRCGSVDLRAILVTATADTDHYVAGAVPDPDGDGPDSLDKLLSVGGGRCFCPQGLL